MNLDKLNNIKVPEELENIKNKVYMKKKKKTFRNIVIASVCVFLLGFTVPSYTKDLPVYSQIFNIFDMKNYQNFSTGINEEITKKDITITVEEGIYTGDKVALTYKIKSDKFNGEELYIDTDLNIKDMDISGAAGSSEITYINDNTYVGYIDMIFFADEKLDEKLVADFKITGITNSETDETTKANWKFSFPLEKIESKIIKNDFIVENEGFFAKIDELSIDNVGNQYKIKFWNDRGYSMMEFYGNRISILDSDNKEIKLFGVGGSSKEEFAEFYWRSESLPKGEYKFIVELNKDIQNGGMAVANAFGKMETVSEKEFKKINEEMKERLKDVSDSIIFEIPFTIE